MSKWLLQRQILDFYQSSFWMSQDAKVLSSVVSHDSIFTPISCQYYAWKEAKPTQKVVLNVCVYKQSVYYKFSTYKTGNSKCNVRTSSCRSHCPTQGHYEHESACRPGLQCSSGLKLPQYTLVIQPAHSILWNKKLSALLPLILDPIGSQCIGEILTSVLVFIFHINSICSSYNILMLCQQQVQVSSGKFRQVQVSSGKFR